MLVRNRVPRTFFETSGVGESDITVHAGSFHLALRQAQIEMANIMTYSSILPAKAELLPIPSSGEIVHGEVMEAIIAQSDSTQGERATAGIIYARMYRDGEDVGGLVCEYNGDMTEEEVRPHLRDMLNELYTNGYEHNKLGEPRYLVESIVPEKKYGTALVALCFTSFEIEEIQ